MTDSERRAIKQVRVLWPYINFGERYEWINRFRHLYDDDFVRTVEALTGKVIR